MPDWPEEVVAEPFLADPQALARASELRDAYRLLQSQAAWKDLVAALQKEAEKRMRELTLEPMDGREHTAGRLVGWIACIQFIQRQVVLQANARK